MSAKSRVTAFLALLALTIPVPLAQAHVGDNHGVVLAEGPTYTDYRFYSANSNWDPWSDCGIYSTSWTLTVYLTGSRQAAISGTSNTAPVSGTQQGVTMSFAGSGSGGGNPASMADFATESTFRVTAGTSPIWEVTAVSLSNHFWASCQDFESSWNTEGHYDQNIPYQRVQPPGPPSEPRNVILSILSSTSLDGSWAAPTSDGNSAITGYEYELHEGTTSGPIEASGTTTGLGRTFTGLDDDTMYCLRVRAQNAYGTSAWSATWCEFTPPNSLSAPRNVVMTPVTPTHLDSSWDSPQDDGGSPVQSYTYELYQGTVSGGALARTATIPGTTAAFSQLAPDTMHCLRVKATTTAPADSPWSDTWCEFTQEGQAATPEAGWIVPDPDGEDSYSTNPGVPHQFTAQATAHGNNLATMRFYSGIGTTGTLLCTDTEAPFECAISRGPGTYFLTIQATANGVNSVATSTSFDVVESQNRPPNLSWVFPQDEGTYQTDEDLQWRGTAQATATDSDGQVTAVRFYQGIGTLGTLVCTVTTAPYTCPLERGVGEHFYTATATDDDGAVYSYFILITVTDGSECNGNCEGPDGDQDGDHVPDSEDPDQGGDSTPDATVATTGLVGFDVDPTGNVIITRQTGAFNEGDDVRTYSGATLALTGRTGTNCGQRSAGVAAMHTHTVYIQCSDGGFLQIPAGDMEEIRIRSPSLGEPTQPGQCQDGDHCDDDIPRDELSFDDSLANLATVADYPIDWSNGQNSWDDFANNNIALAFTTTDGEVGVVALSQRNNAQDRHDLEKRNIGGGQAPDAMCSVRDSDGRSFIYASSRNANVQGYRVNFDFSNDWLTGHHFEVDFQSEFAGTVGTAGPYGLACGDGKLAILNDEKLTLWRRGATTPYVTIDGVQDPEVRGVAMSEDGAFVAYTDGARINIINATDGELVHAITKLGTGFYGMDMQCNGGAIWVAQAGGISRWDIWAATAGTDEACDPPEGGSGGETCGSGCNGGGTDPNGSGTGGGSIDNSGSYGCDAGGMLSLICSLSGITQFMLGLGVIAGAAFLGHKLGSGSPIVVLFFAALGLVAATVFKFVPGWVIIAIGAVGVVILATSWIRSVKAVRT